MPYGVPIGVKKPQQRFIPYHGVVILDGPDATGKTTLANEILKQTDGCGKYIHLRYRYPDYMFLYQLAALHWIHKWSYYGVVVVDRHWISEGVYANVYRGGTRWPHMGRMMDRAFQGMGAMNVLCLPEDLDAHERLFKELKGQRFEMYDNMTKVTRRYIKLWEGDPMTTGSDYTAQLTRFGGVKRRDDFMRYCYTENARQNISVADFARTCLEKTDSRKQAQPLMTTKRTSTANGETHGYNHNFSGFLDTAEWIIVGDMCNPKYHSIRYPFLDYSNSSLFLADCLSEIGFDETRAIYINVNDYYGAVGIVDALKRKPNLRILCLGRDALDGLQTRCQVYLTSLAVYPEIYKTCHPSYAARFNQRALLIRDLGNLLGVRHDELRLSVPTN